MTQRLNVICIKVVIMTLPKRALEPECHLFWFCLSANTKRSWEKKIWSLVQKCKKFSFNLRNLNEIDWTWSVWMDFYLISNNEVLKESTKANPATNVNLNLCNLSFKPWVTLEYLQLAQRVYSLPPSSQPSQFPLPCYLTGCGVTPKWGYQL